MWAAEQVPREQGILRKIHIDNDMSVEVIIERVRAHQDALKKKHAKKQVGVQRMRLLILSNVDVHHSNLALAVSFFMY